MSATNVSTVNAAAARAAAKATHADLIFNVDLFLLCAVAMFVLLLLPRAAIRFTHKREWTNGHLLRSVTLTPPAYLAHARSKAEPVIAPVTPARLARTQSKRAHFEDDVHDEKERWGNTTDASHTYASHADLLRKASTASGRERRKQNVPTHMPGWSTILPKIAEHLRITINPGLTIGKGLVLSLYLAVMLYGGLFDSNPLTDPLRSGFLAASQIPFIFMLATKNNILGMMIGFGYERLNYLHRFAGRVFVLAVNVHAFGFFYSWSLAGTFARNAARPSTVWALIALAAADILYLGSQKFFREKFYNSIFIPTHIFSALLLLVATCKHVPWATNYVLVAVAFYLLDRVMRIIKSRVAIAHLRPLPDLGMTRVEIPTINAGWRAGQHVRLRVLSLGMGALGFTEAHPFTIASVSRSPSGEGLVLMCKKAGDWTERLYNLAQRADYGEANGVGADIKVVVEGPYGGPGHAIFGSFSGAMFVAGGSGITFALASVRDLMQKDLEYKSRVRAIDLVWCVQDPAALGPLIPLFASLLSQAQTSYAYLRISVFYTRAPGSADALKPFRRLPPGLTLSPARPKLPQMLDSLVECSCQLFRNGQERRRGGGALTGILVGVCGPQGLGDEVRRAVAGFDQKRRKVVGGIELHEEAFGW